jgi:predicted nucleic acid-binding Zn ribbon protein
MTPLEEGLSGHAKKRSTVRCRDSPVFHDMLKQRGSERKAVVTCARSLPDNKRACGNARREDMKVTDGRPSQMRVLFFCLSFLLLHIQF